MGENRLAEIAEDQNDDSNGDGKDTKDEEAENPVKIRNPFDDDEDEEVI
jgi:hypothetical protein